MKKSFSRLLPVMVIILVSLLLANSACADWEPEDRFQPKTRDEYAADGLEIKQSANNDYEYVMLWQDTATGGYTSGRIEYNMDGSFRSITRMYHDYTDGTYYDSIYNPITFVLESYQTLRYTPSGAEYRKRYKGNDLIEETIWENINGTIIYWIYNPSDPRKYYKITSGVEETITQQVFEEKKSTLDSITPYASARDVVKPLSDYQLLAGTSENIRIENSGEYSTVTISEYYENHSHWYLTYKSGVLNTIRWARGTDSRGFEFYYDVNAYDIIKEQISFAAQGIGVTYYHEKASDGGFDRYYKLDSNNHIQYHIKQSEFESVLNGGMPVIGKPSFDPDSTYIPKTLAWYQNESEHNPCITISETTTGGVLSGCIVRIDCRDGYKWSIMFDSAGSYKSISLAYYPTYFASNNPDYEAYNATYDISTYALSGLGYECMLSNGGRHYRNTDLSGSLKSENINFSDGRNSLTYYHYVRTTGDAYYRIIQPGNKRYDCTQEEFEAVLNGGEPDWSIPMPANVIRLPESLTTIEADAFAGATSVEAVLIPESVTDIDPSAFTSRPVIYGKPGTYAEEFASQNGLTFIPIE